MSLSLLIVTPQKSFGEHIAQSVQEKHAARVTIVDSQREAIFTLGEEYITHAFLDMDLDESISDLGLALRQKRPDLPLVIISAQQSIPRLDALHPWQYLRKPFFLPDLLRVLGQEKKPALSVARFEQSEQVEIPSVKEENIPLRWLSDAKAKAKAVPHLTRLTLESAAQATLIVREGALWAYAGQLSEEAADELVQIVVRDKKTGDLLKFLRLKATDAEHMLFATVLIDDVTLAMIFDGETPFSAIRNQASQLVDSLIVLEPKTMPMEPVSAEKTEEENEERDEAEELLDLFDFDEEDDAPPISDILSSIPNPNPRNAASEAKTSAPSSTPSSQPASASGVHQEPMPNPFAKTRASTAVDERVKPVKESSPAIRASDFFENGEVDLDETRVQEAQPEQHIEFDLDETRVSKSQRPETPIEKPSPEELASTRPQSITTVGEAVKYVASHS